MWCKKRYVIVRISKTALTENCHYTGKFYLVKNFTWHFRVLRHALKHFRYQWLTVSYLPILIGQVAYYYFNFI